ncbi:tetratricopeptide repeat protein [Pseudodesulfovibrio sp. zrk46]|uniref:tetratricopeptide repeat protein n=1 Tax=Pseudodesulfovibrio sp. zrk46 TaxID=2725288 RepID=UPI00144993CC|nr:tetratricopeptide repeat protein [Pseudodesulfovibrio sp. zrk46]QJB55466.1 tetratricopeptide repeat protein [Pseudodesulfovibrio sp. zrk46]
MTEQRFMDLDLDDDFGDDVRRHGSVRCAFSSSESTKVGTGTTTRKHVSKIYWYVEEAEPRAFHARQINANYVPSGDGKTTTVKELMNKYVPEIEFFEEKVIPAMEQLEDHLDEGEHQREEGKLYSAEGCFNKALAMDEMNVRALFNLGMIYMELEDMGKARDMMGNLLHVKSAFDGKNQHLFNEFGISLRKSGLFDEAVAYYTQALDYTTDDENLFYNLARAHYERSDWQGCTDALEQIFKLNPSLVIAQELVEIVHTLSGDSGLCSRKSKRCIPSDIARRINTLYATHVNAPQLRGVIQIQHNKGSAPQVGRARSGK